MKFPKSSISEAKTLEILPVAPGRSADQLKAGVELVNSS